MILSLCTAATLNENLDRTCQIHNDFNEDYSIALNTDHDDVRIELSGKYGMALSNDIIEEMYRDNTVSVKWHTNDNEKKINQKLRLHPVFVKCLHRHITEISSLCIHYKLFDHMNNVSK
jgi:hypothetical protein